MFANMGGGGKGNTADGHLERLGQVYPQLPRIRVGVCIVWWTRSAHVRGKIRRYGAIGWPLTYCHGGSIAYKFLCRLDALFPRLERILVHPRIPQRLEMLPVKCALSGSWSSAE